MDQDQAPSISELRQFALEVEREHMLNRPLAPGLLALARGYLLAEHVRDAVYVCATCGQVPYAQVYRPGLDDDEERRHMRTHCAGNGGDSAVDYTPAGLYLARPSTDTLLAEFFDIDLTAVERERRALLANLPR